MNKLNSDGIGYYLSCMIPFNVIYLIMLMKDGMCDSLYRLFYFWSVGIIYPNPKLKTWINYITALFTILFVIFGIVATIQILRKDDSVENSHTFGKKVKAVNVEDLTSENYFANFSLIVLTALSIPAWKGLYSILIYFAVLIMLGIVYIKKRIIYMNPILTLGNYSIYRCKNYNEEQGGNRTYIFVIKGGQIKEGEEVTYKNIPDDIIRLNHKPG